MKETDDNRTGGRDQRAITATHTVLALIDATIAASANTGQGSH